MKRTLAFGITALVVLTGCGGKLNSTIQSRPATSSAVASSAAPSSEPASAEPTAEEASASSSSAPATTEAAPSSESSSAEASSVAPTTSAPADDFSPSIDMVAVNETYDYQGLDLSLKINKPVVAGVPAEQSQAFRTYYEQELAKKLDFIGDFYKDYYETDKQLFCDASPDCLPGVSGSNAKSSVLGDYVNAVEYLGYNHPRGRGNTSVVAASMNIKSGQALTFDDVFPNGFELTDVQPVDPYPAECLTNQQKKTNLEYASFTIAEDGVHIYWDKDTMGMMSACGAPEGLVPGVA